MGQKAYFFIFHKDSLLLQKKRGGYFVPQSAVVPPGKSKIHIFQKHKGRQCKTYAVKTLSPLPEGFETVDLRTAFKLLDKDCFNLAGHAAQLLHWDANSAFCPACGAKTAHAERKMKKCPSCGKEIYTAITPAVMVLVRKGRQILMVHGLNFKRKNYGLVAGFLEAGETLEQCASREVAEETGVKIKNLRYFTSQPWPFPSNVMIGFFADYAGGRVKIEKKELSDAAFFDKNNLPPLPGRISLARKMVDAWLKTQK